MVPRWSCRTYAAGCEPTSTRQRVVCPFELIHKCHHELYRCLSQTSEEGNTSLMGGNEAHHDQILRPAFSTPYSLCRSPRSWCSCTRAGSAPSRCCPTSHVQDKDASACTGLAVCVLGSRALMGAAVTSEQVRRSSAKDVNTRASLLRSVQL